MNWRWKYFSMISIQELNLEKIKISIPKHRPFPSDYIPRNAKDIIQRTEFSRCTLFIYFISTETLKSYSLKWQLLFENELKYEAYLQNRSPYQIQLTLSTTRWFLMRFVRHLLTVAMNWMVIAIWKHSWMLDQLMSALDHQWGSSFILSVCFLSKNNFTTRQIPAQVHSWAS